MNAPKASALTGVDRVARGLGGLRPWRAPQQQRTAPRAGRIPGIPDSPPEWDPEGLFGKRQTGHIARRQKDRMMQQDKKFAEEMAQMKTEAERELWAQREARVVPEEDDDLVEFLLDTDMTEMSFEVARCRPRLTPSFFKHLDKVIGMERFGAKPDEDRLAELDSLRDYLQEAVDAVDEATKQTGSAVDRLRKLLSAKDKKAMILEMVSNNEIDRPLMDLLDQNIAIARGAGEEPKVEFMEKLSKACSKYLIEAEPTSLPDKPPSQGGERSSGLIL